MHALCTMLHAPLMATIKVPMFSGDDATPVAAFGASSTGTDLILQDASFYMGPGIWGFWVWGLGFLVFGV